MEFIDFFLEFLHENYYFLIPVLWIMGYALKQTPWIPNWSIIWLLFGVSVSLGACAYGFTFDAIVNGIIATGVAVFGHQMYKQTMGRIQGKTK